MSRSAGRWPAGPQAAGRAARGSPHRGPQAGRRPGRAACHRAGPRRRGTAAGGSWIRPANVQPREDSARGARGRSRSGGARGRCHRADHGGVSAAPLARERGGPSTRSPRPARPDVASEPNQINFACANATGRSVWVLLAPDDQRRNNPRFADTKTGRRARPSTPAQGGEVASSLNLHHPVDPAEPNRQHRGGRAGHQRHHRWRDPDRQRRQPRGPGGAGERSGQLRQVYRLGGGRRRAGYPAICASPVTSPAGQAALVADVYQRWFSGSSPVFAGEDGVLFQNSTEPGNPQVRRSSRACSGLRPRPSAGRDHGSASTPEGGGPVQSTRKARSQQATALVSLSTAGAMTGLSVAHGTGGRTFTSPTSIPVKLLASSRRDPRRRPATGRCGRRSSRPPSIPASGAKPAAVGNGGADLAERQQ